MSNAPYGAMPAGPAPWPQPAPPSYRGPSRWPMFVALAIAVVAIAVAIASWFRPAPHAAKTTHSYTAQETADAKKAVCAAYEKVHAAVDVTIRTGESNTATDPTSVVAFAANVRLAAYAGGDYLNHILDGEPATPSDLTKNLRNLADNYLEVAILQMGAAPGDGVKSAVQSIDNLSAIVGQDCR